MLINILLPGSAQFPVGGFKVVFEHANRLAAKGYRINIILPLLIDNCDKSILTKLKLKIAYLKEKFFRNYLPGKWFKFEKNINVMWVFSLEEKNIPDADILIATSWHTAKKCYDYSGGKGKKVYFIQSLETWHGEYKEVIETWKMPFKKIVISNWLLEFAKSLGLEATLIYNGFDFKKFGIDILPENRNPLSVGMLYHLNKIKGSEIGIKAFIKLKKEYPDLKVNLFGVCKRQEDIPAWMDYTENPDQDHLRRIYNKLSIFVNPSIMEGFALMPAEAMICGCASVVSDIGGHKDYSINEETSLLFIPKNSDSLAEKIKLLIKNNDMRIKLSYWGNKYIQKFNWQTSNEKFEQVIREIKCMR